VPSLEQVFTFVDLSSKSGHNLGKSYYPAKLRALRRFLIYKLFLIIDKSINLSSCRGISDFFNKTNHCNYVSLNWDIVLEQCLQRYLQKDFSYGVDETFVKISRGSAKPINISGNLSNASLKIAKVHGSANWAYCDNCRKIFCMKDTKITKVIQSGIYISDIKMFYPPHETDVGNKKLLKEKIRKNAKMKECPECNCALGSHIATFSYNKSFRTHAFSDSWKLAETILTGANKWMFIGYSLPEADFEFAHMLKYVQKKADVQKEIIVIVKDDSRAQNQYESLFGRNNVRLFNNGLEDFISNELNLLI